MAAPAQTPSIRTRGAVGAAALVLVLGVLAASCGGSAPTKVPDVGTGPGNLVAWCNAYIETVKLLDHPAAVDTDPDHLLRDAETQLGQLLTTATPAVRADTRTLFEPLAKALPGLIKKVDAANGSLVTQVFAMYDPAATPDSQAASDRLDHYRAAHC